MKFFMEIYPEDSRRIEIVPQVGSALPTFNFYLHDDDAIRVNIPANLTSLTKIFNEEYADVIFREVEEGNSIDIYIPRIMRGVAEQLAIDPRRAYELVEADYAPKLEIIGKRYRMYDLPARVAANILFLTFKSLYANILIRRKRDVSIGTSRGVPYIVIREDDEVVQKQYRRWGIDKLNLVDTELIYHLLVSLAFCLGEMYIYYMQDKKKKIPTGFLKDLLLVLHDHYLHKEIVTLYDIHHYNLVPSFYDFLVFATEYDETGRTVIREKFKDYAIGPTDEERAQIAQNIEKLAKILVDNVDMRKSHQGLLHVLDEMSYILLELTKGSFQSIKYIRKLREVRENTDFQSPYQATLWNFLMILSIMFKLHVLVLDEKGEILERLSWLNIGHMPPHMVDLMQLKTFPITFYSLSDTEIRWNANAPHTSNPDNNRYIVEAKAHELSLLRPQLESNVRIENYTLITTHRDAYLGEVDGLKIVKVEGHSSGFASYRIKISENSRYKLEEKIEIARDRTSKTGVVFTEGMFKLINKTNGDVPCLKEVLPYITIPKSIRGVKKALLYTFIFGIGSLARNLFPILEPLTELLVKDRGMYPLVEFIGELFSEDREELMSFYRRVDAPEFFAWLSVVVPEQEFERISLLPAQEVYESKSMKRRAENIMQYFPSIVNVGSLWYNIAYRGEIIE